MKVAVVNNCVPFVTGGAEHLADALTSKLVEYGHEAILIRIPFSWEPPHKIVECMLASRMLRIPGVDRVIALKFPAYYLPHPNKVLWLLHQFRQAYDLWNTEYQGLPDTPDGNRIRETIIQADNIHLRAVKKIYTNSQVTSGRLKTFNDIDSEVLFPPLLSTSQFSCREFGDYIFYPSRIVASKRQLLVCNSMRYVTSDVRLLIAGKEESPADLKALRDVIRDGKLEKRVELMPRFISEQEKADLFSRALGCAYTPYDEDSYGYVTLESYCCHKPVITCTDSGGTLVVVKDGQTGFVVPPDPKAIAQAMDALYLDKSRAQKMGEAGAELVRTLRIDWAHVIEALTA